MTDQWPTLPNPLKKLVVLDPLAFTFPTQHSSHFCWYFSQQNRSSGAEFCSLEIKRVLDDVYVKCLEVFSIWKRNRHSSSYHSISQSNLRAQIVLIQEKSCATTSAWNLTLSFLLSPWGTICGMSLIHKDTVLIFVLPRAYHRLSMCLSVPPSWPSLKHDWRGVSRRKISSTPPSPI